MGPMGAVGMEGAPGPTLFPISALAASKHPFPELAANKSAPQNFSEIAANELGFPN